MKRLKRFEEVEEVEDVEESLTMFPATSCGEQCSLVSLGTPKSDVNAAAFQEKAGYMRLLPVQGGAEDTDKRVWALPTEECT